MGDENFLVKFEAVIYFADRSFDSYNWISQKEWGEQ